MVWILISEIIHTTNEAAHMSRDVSASPMAITLALTTCCSYVCIHGAHEMPIMRIGWAISNHRSCCSVGALDVKAMVIVTSGLIEKRGSE